MLAEALVARALSVPSLVIEHPGTFKHHRHAPSMSMSMSMSPSSMSRALDSCLHDDDDDDDDRDRRTDRHTRRAMRTPPRARERERARAPPHRRRVPPGMYVFIPITHRTTPRRRAGGREKVVPKNVLRCDRRRRYELYRNFPSAICADILFF